MQEAANTTSPVSSRAIAQRRGTRWLAMLALCAPWFAVCASTPTAGLACAAGQAECASYTKPKVVVDADEWKSAGDPRGLMVLIQSNLDRVSADQPVWPAPKGAMPDPLLKIVDAYADFLRDDFKGMDAVLAEVDAAATLRRAAAVKALGSDIDGFYRKADSAYSARLATGMRSGTPLVKLYAGLRAVDGALWNGMGDPSYVADRSSGERLDGEWLRLPCRTVIGRAPQFAVAAADLKSMGGPVLDCPVDGPVDYAKDEALALHPENLDTHSASAPATTENIIAAVAKPSPLPDGRDAALGEMDVHTQQAASVLERYSHVDSLGELDYALFLHAFEPETPARDATIRGLVTDIDAKVHATGGWMGNLSTEPYNGTDASLVDVIAAASVSGVAASEPGAYAIPCAILTTRPALAAAIVDGGNQPRMASANLPRSGCEEGRGGTLALFPGDAVDAFTSAATDAEGNFYAAESERDALFSAQSTASQAMRLDPRSFLKALHAQPADSSAETGFDYPYQVWGYTSLNDYLVSLRVRKLYLSARDQLALYYQHKGLSRTDGLLAAKLALLASAPGSTCGGDVPVLSIRRMLLEHAPPHDIEQLLGNADADAPEIYACAKYAYLDPALLVAVGDPAAFPLVLKAVPDPDERNVIGKTALMEAAQFNQPGIVNLLLAKHARINATTWDHVDQLELLDDHAWTLADDARTALMYAAANGSLDMIRALLGAGADPYQADTKGYRAIDYLLGYGPTPPNPHLSGHQREQAARWLF